MYSIQIAIMLPPEGVLTQEFGTVILKWYSDHYNLSFDAHREFYVNNFGQLKKYLEELAPLLASNNETEVKWAIKKQEELKKNMKRLAVIQKEVFLPKARDMKNINIGESSSSSSDNPEVNIFSIPHLTTTLGSTIQANHAVHKMFRTIRAFYNNDFAKSIN